MSDSLCCQVQQLSHLYKTHVAVNQVTFDITSQSIHGFVGPNGAGKTTTLKVLATLAKPQAGKVTMFGMDIAAQFKSVRRRIGYMQDHFSMYRKMTVFEYLDFFGAAYGLSQSARDKPITNILALTDMSGRRDDLITGLSRGMQQRVSLARALVHDPDLLLLDEPASGLDPRARIELMEILQELRNLGKTIFISSHILSELSTLCDHVTILDRGEVKYSGSIGGLVKNQSPEGAYRIELEALIPEVEAALQALPGFVSLETVEKTNAYRVRMEAAPSNPTRLIEAVFQNGGQLKSFREDVKQLSEAFMDLTQPGVRS
ncbi:MAG: ABC transporter ATP-binding protein [Verrucomicrobiales bacterium]